jgi:hypothetical protein
LARCLAKDSSHRYLDARDLAEDLTDLLEGRPPRHLVDWTSPPPRAAGTVTGPLEGLLEPVASTAAIDPAPVLPTGRRKAATPGMPARSRWRQAGLYVDLGVVAAVVAVAAWVLVRPGGLGDRVARAGAEPPAAAAPPAAPSSTAGLAAPSPSEASPSRAPTAPGPTPAVAATPTPKPTPKPARIVLDFRHPLRRGTLSIFVDEKRVLKKVVRGNVDKNLVVVKTHEGSYTDLVWARPGRHTFEVEVRWDDQTRRERIRARFLPGETYRLEIRLGGRLKKNLSLKWTR